MEAPVTVRLDRNTRRKLAKIAERRRISKSEVIRQALNSWPEFHEADRSPYEAMKSFIGILDGADPKRSEGGGRKFKAFLKR